MKLRVKAAEPLQGAVLADSALGDRLGVRAGTLRSQSDTFMSGTVLMLVELTPALGPAIARP